MKSRPWYAPQSVLKSALVVLIAVTALFPLAWMAMSGFKGKTEVLRSPFQFFPDVWNLQNYRDQ